MDFRLDKEMTSETIRTAAYLLNRSPTTDSKETPAENWFEKKPDLSN